MTRKLFFAFVIMTSAIHLNAQRRIDLVTLKTIVTDPNSASFYDSLVVKFVKNPKSIDLTMAVRLYYGKMYSKYYAPFKVTEQERAFNKALKRRKFKKAIPIGEAILKSDPVSLETTVNLLIAYKQEKLFEKEDLLGSRLKVLMKAVQYSGTGDDEASPIKVVSVGDEYAIMAIMGYVPVKRSSVMTLSSTIDSWIVRDLKTNGQFNLSFEVLLNFEGSGN